MGSIRARHRLAALASLLLALGPSACKKDPAEPVYRDPRAPCASRDPARALYWGDLHVHTGYSFDAWVFDVRTTPEDAYRFARGESVALPPLDAEGRPSRQLRLDRPLDFVAVTDHSEYFGEVEICKVPGLGGHDSRRCERYRAGDDDVVVEFGSRLTDEAPVRFADVCGSTGERCAGPAREVWQRVQDAAEAAYDRSEACRFTSFVAYEYTAVTDVSNLHRNVIFRNDRVPAFAASYFDFPTPLQLWRVLRSSCLEAGNGCDVLAIPHNSNWSNGRLFAVEYPGARTMEEEAAQARLRGELEPLMEIFQHKGDMECSPGLSGILGPADEACRFEKLKAAPVDCGDGTGAGGAGGVGCVSRLDFLRGILLEGLREGGRLGVNPYRVGVVASTDTHNGTPGEVREDRYAGHWGNNEDTVEERLDFGRITPGGVLYGGGGLTGVWAIENSRDALFDALRRREVYGTSGPRIAVRLFGGFELPPDGCDREDFVAAGDRGGVPMGGTLRGPAATAPRFWVQALMDAGTAERPGTPLATIQIVKGWLDAGGQAHVEVHDVAGDPEAGTVDLDSCASSGGRPSLCAVWTDPDFDPSRPAWYYARVLEAPVCRWSWQACRALPENARPPACADPAVEKAIRERAWTSPIWFEP
jgi:hypothetical protein